MAITLTNKAAQRMNDFLSNRGSGLGVRLSVQTTGCSGLGYNMEFVDAVNGDDTLFEDKGVIEDAKFKTYGCGSAIASSSLLTEWVKGKTVDEASEIKNTEIVEELELPPVKIHCSVLAEDAIKAAIDDLKSKAG